MKKLGILILIFLSVTKDLMAEDDCRPVNLSHHFGKVYDQRDVNWCYAYSASDLLFFKYASYLKGKAVSPIHLALLNNFNEGAPASAVNGTVKETIKIATYPFDETYSGPFFKGVCSASVDENLNVQTFHTKLKESDSMDAGLNYMDELCPYAIRFVFPKVEHAVNVNIGGVMTYVPSYGGRTVTVKIDNAKQILEILHQQLDGDNVASIGYYSGFLKMNQAARTELHASTVVGREKIGNSCHIIIRNSWGDGNYPYSKFVSKQMDGYIWVDETVLLKYLDGITYLEK